MAKPRRTGRPRGRPSKLTPEIQKQIVADVRACCYAQVAAQCAGIDESTFYDWLKWGDERPGTIYADFAKAVKTAEAEAERELAREIRSVVDTPEAKTATARITFAQRRWPGRWHVRNEMDLKKAQLECKRMEAEIELLKAKLAETNAGVSREPIEIVVRDYGKGD